MLIIWVSSVLTLSMQPGQAICSKAQFSNNACFKQGCGEDYPKELDVKCFKTADGTMLAVVPEQHLTSLMGAFFIFKTSLPSIPG